MRVPNPEVEKEEAKLLAETLEMIPRSYDYARSLGLEHPPIFEVILPMTRSSEELMKVHSFYRDFVAGKGRFELMGERISDWLGDFLPEEISVIPLFEDRESLMRAAEIAREYAEWAGMDSMRVFLARSDPAMNYGFVAATVKKALFDLSQLEISTFLELVRAPSGEGFRLRTSAFWTSFRQSTPSLLNQLSNTTTSLER